MADDYERERAWVPHMRELDSENHDLRKRLRLLTDAAGKVLAFAGHPPVWTLLRQQEQDAVHALAAAFAYDDSLKRSPESRWLPDVVVQRARPAAAPQVRQ